MNMAPTLPTSCGSLPPEGAVLAWGGPALPSAGAAAPAAWRSRFRGSCRRGIPVITIAMCSNALASGVSL